MCVEFHPIRVHPISFHVYRKVGSNADTKLVEDLGLGNGNAAGPLVSAWRFEYIDSPM